MRFLKIITALKSMDAADRRRLGKYLQSPYFEAPEAAVALYDYLSNIRQTFSAQDLEPAAIARKSPLLKTSGLQAKAGTQLLEEIKKYVAKEYRRLQPYDQQRDLLHGLKQRHWFDWYEKELALARHTLDKDCGQSLEYFAQQHYLTEIEHNGFDVKLSKIRHGDITPVVDSLDIYYAIKKIRYLCEAANRKQSGGERFDASGAEAALALLAPYNTPVYSYVYLFVAAYRMFTAATYSEAAPYVLRIKKQVDSMKDNPAPASLVEVVNCVESYSVHLANGGIDEATNHYLWCIEFHWKNGTLLHQGKIAPVAFGNIIRIAMRSARPAEAIRLWIDRLVPCLPTEAQQIQSHFAEGIYSFAEGQYAEAAFRFGQSFSAEEPVHTAIAKRWQWMSRYEADAADPGLDAQLAAYERYVQRHSDIPQSIKAAFAQFIGYAKKLLRQPLHTHSEQLLTQLTAEKYFSGKDWLLEKLAHGK